MSEKVNVPRKIADALDKVISEKEKGNEWAFFNIVRCGKDQLDEHAAIVKEYFNGVRMLDLARVFINGYEVHLTPEDKVREIHNRASVPAQVVVEDVLNVLGIKIEGVNA